MWLNICQGLVLVGWVWRLVAGVIRASVGRDKQEPSGFLGIFITLVWCAMSGVIVWRSGALSTILGSP